MKNNGFAIALLVVTAVFVLTNDVGCGDKRSEEEIQIEQLAHPVRKVFDTPRNVDVEVVRVPEAIEGTSLVRVHIKRGRTQIVSTLVSKELASTLKVGDRVEERCVAFVITYGGGETFVCTIKVQQ